MIAINLGLSANGVSENVKTYVASARHGILRQYLTLIVHLYYIHLFLVYYHCARKVREVSPLQMQSVAENESYA